MTIKPDNEHNYCHIIFSTAKVEERIKDKFKYTTISGKEEVRFKSMIEHGQEIASAAFQHQDNAIKMIATGKEEDYILSLMGFTNHRKDVGVMICKNCLDRAILSLEENINILKDIKENLKCHAN